MRIGIASVNTIAKPEYTAPATKYGGKIVVCQPAMAATAKSKLMVVCTESTSGVLNPASSSDADSYRIQCRVDPRQPSERMP